MTKASTSTRVPLEAAPLVPPLVPSTFTSRVCATDGSSPFCTKTNLRACVVELYRSTVMTLTPSVQTSALPRLLPLGATQAALRAPVKVSLAESPEELACVRLPPEALLRISAVQAPVYWIAASVSCRTLTLKRGPCFHPLQLPAPSCALTWNW